MRSGLWISTGILLASAASTAPAQGPAKRGRLVMHEWGTFTTLSNAEGASLEYRPAVGAGLPEFVFDLGRWVDAFGQHPPLMPRKEDLSAQVRMETPVMYFYSPDVQHVRVKVDFPRGLLTEFYPPPRTVTPAGGTAGPQRIAGGSLDWGTVELIPPDLLSAVSTHEPLNHRPALPAVPPGDPYAHARDVKANFVRVLLPDRGFLEKFLFYRGVGNFRLPITAKMDNEGVVRLSSPGMQPLSSVFLMSDECCGRVDVRFVEHRNVRGEVALKLPEKTRTTYELADAVARALTEAGLYELEARAMVKTWQEQWFETPGTRLFYIVPRDITDALLPVTIEPQPDEVVRVLVARVELSSPAVDAEIERLVGLFISGTTEERADAAAKLAGRQPFSQAALLEAARREHNADTRKRIETLLASWRDGC